MKMSGEPALVDTNVLVYSVFADSPHHSASRQVLEQARREDAKLCLAFQCLAEFYSIITNPKRVSPAMQPAEAVEAVRSILALPGMTLLSQPHDIAERWTQLIDTHPVRGGNVFDLQLIATMLGNGVHRIYTFDVTDFSHFAEVEAVSPG